MTVHVPAVAYESDVPLIEHPAVPASVKANVTTPPPDPPVVARAENDAGAVTAWAVVTKAA